MNALTNDQEKRIQEFTRAASKPAVRQKIKFLSVQ